MQRGIVQRRLVDRRQLHQVAQGQHAVRLEHVERISQAKLRREHVASGRIHPASDFEPNDGRETSVAQLGLDQLEQVVGLVLVALGVGVAGDAEQLAGHDVQAREQQVQRVRHDIFERDEVASVADLQEARECQSQRAL